jgi:hypothetical protein
MPLLKRKVRIMRRASIIASISMIILSIFVIMESLKFKTAGASLTLGPGFYPRLLSVLLILLSICIIVISLRSKDDAKLVLINNRVLSGIVIIIGYGIVFNILGFVLSSMIMFALISKAMGGSNWKIILTNSILIPVGIYLVFNNFLRVPLPWGLFENLL